MKRIFVGLALWALMPAAALAACAVTLNSGGNIHSAASTYSGQEVCLNSGSYSLGSTVLELGANTTLKGLGAAREDVVITSTATRAIVTADGVWLNNFLLDGPGGSSEYGILSYYDSDVVIWGIKVKEFYINIGVNGSDGTQILDTFMWYPGYYSNSNAEPNLYITDASDIYVYYGQALGLNNGGGGDGEISVYNSTDVVIEGTYVDDSGASAIYMVNCDSCEVTGTTINGADEWGIDIVSGSDNFSGTNNYVAGSGMGGAVFDESGSTGGTWTGNTFYYNRQSWSVPCNGINVVGSTGGVTHSGNTATPSPTICTFTPP